LNPTSPEVCAASTCIVQAFNRHNLQESLSLNFPLPEIAKTVAIKRSLHASLSLSLQKSTGDCSNKPSQTQTSLFTWNSTVIQAPIPACLQPARPRRSRSDGVWQRPALFRPSARRYQVHALKPFLPWQFQQVCLSS